MQRWIRSIATVGAMTLAACAGAQVTWTVAIDHPGATTTRSMRGVIRISTKELIRRGMRDLIRADLNRDGWLDTQDVEVFMTGGGSSH